MGVSETMVNELTQDIVHPLNDIRLAASMGLSTAIGEKSDLSAQIVTTLLEIYQDKVKVFIIISDCIFLLINVQIKLSKIISDYYKSNGFDGERFNIFCSSPSSRTTVKTVL